MIEQFQSSFYGLIQQYSNGRATTQVQQSVGAAGSEAKSIKSRKCYYTLHIRFRYLAS